MPRHYKPDPRGRRYIKHDIEEVKRALEDIKNGGSYRVVSLRYAIPTTVLHRHVHKEVKPQGGQPILSNEVEEYIIESINICADWGYPLDTYDLRLVVKGYLDMCGLNVNKFTNNMPGIDFAMSFLKRHKSRISERFCQNIKRSRAAVSSEIIEEYFKNLQISLEGVPPSHIINYDETNLSDDPGKKKIITRRGCKYPERVMNHSKTSTSVMFAATAVGELLPTYVVYKALHLYDTWCTNGPKSTKYNRSASGWFDGICFDDWVKTIVLEYFKNKPGKKILLGDNLSSHLSLRLINICKEEDIHFVFLPANSTHLSQLLDVAFFRPLKVAWRNILTEWKTKEGRNHGTVPKSTFPKLLKKLLEDISKNGKENILSGFRKTGVSPIDKNQVLARLPQNISSEDSQQYINESVIKILQELRGNDTNAKPKKAKRLSIEPGKSTDNIDPTEGLLENENEENNMTKTEKKQKSAKKKPRKQKPIEKNVREKVKQDDIAYKAGPSAILIQNNINKMEHTEKTQKITTKGKGIGKKTKKLEIREAPPAALHQPAVPELKMNTTETNTEVVSIYKEEGQIIYSQIKDDMEIYFDESPVIEMEIESTDSTHEVKTDAESNISNRFLETEAEPNNSEHFVEMGVESRTSKGVSHLTDNKCVKKSLNNCNVCKKNELKTSRWGKCIACKKWSCEECVGTQLPFAYVCLVCLDK